MHGHWGHQGVWEHWDGGNIVDVRGSGNVGVYLAGGMVLKAF